MRRTQERTLFLAANTAEDIVASGNAALARRGEPRAPLQESRTHAVREHLDRVLRSSHFDGSARSREFLRYVVEEVLAGRAAYLKQATIAVEVFGRRPDFDAVIDPIVRVQAGRLRRSLERYYLLSGDTDTLRIELPKGSYAPVFVDGTDDDAASVTARDSPHDWPTLAIYPLAAQARDEADTATRLHHELAAELCRYGIVRVGVHTPESGPGAPSHAARFELHGMVRAQAADRLVCVRLVDRRSAQQVWADEFRAARAATQASGRECDLGRLIAARIGSENGVITRLLAGESAARSFPPGEDFGAIARYQHFMFSRQAGALLPAIESLQRFTSRSPEVELAWTSLGRLYLMNHAFELSGMFTPVEMAIGCANQSVLLEPASARARCLMAMALLVKGELGAARHELDLAQRHNGDSLAYREVVGWLMALCGEWQPGIALMRSAMERNPYCHPCVSHGLWADAMRRRDFAAAYAAALEYRDATFFWRELMLASSLGQLGRATEAAASASALLRTRPQFARQGLRLVSHFIKCEALLDRIVRGLGNAGLALA